MHVDNTYPQVSSFQFPCAVTRDRIGSSRLGCRLGTLGAVGSKASDTTIPDGVKKKKKGCGRVRWWPRNQTLGPQSKPFREKTGRSFASRFGCVWPWCHKSR